MRRALFVCAVVGALVYAAPAAAGCWATVELSRPPTHIAPGTTWTATLTVLQHGRYPLPDASDARPTITITNRAGERRTFTATPVNPAKGTYAATVVFPSGGELSYAVFDDFTSSNGEPVSCSRRHEIVFGRNGSREIGATYVAPPAEGSAGGGRLPVWPLMGGLAAALLLVGGAVLYRARARRTAVA